MEQSSYQHHSINLCHLSRDNLKHFYLPNPSHQFNFSLCNLCVPCPRSYCSLCHVNLYVLLLLLLLLPLLLLKPHDKHTIRVQAVTYNVQNGDDTVWLQAKKLLATKCQLEFSRAPEVTTFCVRQPRWDDYVGKMTYRPSKLGQTDLCNYSLVLG